MGHFGPKRSNLGIEDFCRMERNNIYIRQAEVSDIDTIVRFNTEMAHETEGIALSHQKLRDGVSAVFEDNTKGFYLVAECNDSIVGQALITYEWSDWRDGMFWWIQSVYVLPDYRRIGVLRSIFECIKRMAGDSSNVCGLRLYVHKDNLTAKLAYENLGMKYSHYEVYELLL